jgi:hypothetical protein
LGGFHRKGAKDAKKSKNHWTGLKILAYFAANWIALAFFSAASTDLWTMEN